MPDILEISSQTIDFHELFFTAPASKQDGDPPQLMALHHGLLPGQQLGISILDR
ncbi:MAG: hypothetical protein LBB55_06670 [Zoogloeaceae bacterium]|jgi:hypothetical protein|nr:hypothetical protein [Zoogloeaceae bacterium]